MGPLQRNLPVNKGAEVMAYSFSRGVNFVDTAELYKTYKYIRAAAKLAGKYPVVATKCYAHDRDTALHSIETARSELDLDVIDIFMLHEQESRYTLDGHRRALETFLEAKSKGIIRAVGVSTHYIEVVKVVADIPWIDVIHPLINMTGLGIQDGNADEMSNAIRDAHSAGKGVYAMKIFGGGNLLSKYGKCLEYVVKKSYFDSIAIGMQSNREVDMNIDALLHGKLPGDGAAPGSIMNKKRLHVDYWCSGCGKCVKRCGQGALRINSDKKAEASHEKCVLCGYCSSVCSEFAIKIC